MPWSRGLPAYFARIARETPKREQIVDTPASVFPRARVASWGTKSITGTARASSSLHQLAVWPPRTATRGNRWGDTHVGSAGGPEGASEAGVSGRFLPFLVVFWPLRARNGQKRPETACRRSVTARLPRPCLGAVGYQLTLHGSLEKRRNESKLSILQLPFFHVLAWRRGAPSQLLAPHGQVAVSTNWPCGHPVRPPGVIGGVIRT